MLPSLPSMDVSGLLAKTAERCSLRDALDGNRFICTWNARLMDAKWRPSWQTFNERRKRKANSHTGKRTPPPPPLDTTARVRLEKSFNHWTQLYLPPDQKPSKMAADQLPVCWFRLNRRRGANRPTSGSIRLGLGPGPRRLHQCSLQSPVESATARRPDPWLSFTSRPHVWLLSVPFHSHQGSRVSFRRIATVTEKAISLTLSHALPRGLFLFHTPQPVCLSSVLSSTSNPR